MTYIQKFLVSLKIVDNEKRNKQGMKRMGKGYFKAYRLNPFNPLSYVMIIILLPILLIMYGFVGLFEKTENPFKWN